MTKTTITTIAAFLFFSAITWAASEFVGINQLDDVFENYSTTAEAYWPAPKLAEEGEKVSAGIVRGSKKGATPAEGPAKAFDGNVKTKYCSLAPTLWLQLHLRGAKTKIVAYELTAANDAPERDPADWTLLGSVDGKIWVELDRRSGEAFAERFQVKRFSLAKPGDYAWYKLNVTKNQGTHTTQLAELELLTAEAAAEKAAPVVSMRDKSVAEGWQPLFNKDLSNAEFPEGVWTVSNGELTASQDKLIISKEEYENFVLDLEFKNGPAANSGVFVYLSDPKGWVQNSVEIQITDDHAQKWAKADPTWRCGAIFGRLAASEQKVKAAGEWNHYTLICRGPFIEVILNGTHVNSMDMRKWDSATHNPNGSKKPGWLSKPLSTHVTKGRVGFQGKHGGAPIWFRNIRIKSLD